MRVLLLCVLPGPLESEAPFTPRSLDLIRSLLAAAAVAMCIGFRGSFSRYCATNAMEGNAGMKITYRKQNESLYRKLMVKC